MKINFFSDIHLEWYDHRLPDNDADIIIAAGDIGKPYDAAEWLKRMEKPVLYVAGNHEYYGGEWRDRMAKLEKHCHNSNVHFMDNSIVHIMGHSFFGATMWTDFDLYRNQDLDMLKAVDYMNDYHQIKLGRGKLDPGYILIKHQKSLEALKEYLDVTEKPMIITHHLPSAMSIHPDYRGHPGNPFYATELSGLFREGMHWFHGHTHSSTEYELFGAHVHCNPRGYATRNRTENAEFDINKIVCL
jgi:Icc-related predicted phosphoesterase